MDKETIKKNSPDSKVHGANMRPICGRQDSGGPHVGPMNFAIWEFICTLQFLPHICYSYFEHFRGDEHMPHPLRLGNSISY